MLRKIWRFLYVFAAVSFAATIAISAQAQPSDKNAQHKAILNDARSLIIRTIGAENNSVDIVTTEKAITVERINSNMNGSSHGARNNEATVIGPIVSQAIAEKPDFKAVIVIRVQYVSRTSSASKQRVLDTIEFRKDASGNFQFHQT
jgi:hypothetical protein